MEEFSLLCEFVLDFSIARTTWKSRSIDGEWNWPNSDEGYLTSNQTKSEKTGRNIKLPLTDKEEGEREEVERT